MTLLIIEDENLILRGLYHIIENSSLEFEHIYTACSAEEANVIVNDEMPSLIITDIHLPEMSGLTFMENLRKIDKTIPCIIISGFAQFDYAQQAISLGINKYLLKPVIPIKLIEAIEESIEVLKEKNVYKQLFLKQLFENSHEISQIENPLENLGISLDQPYFMIIRILFRKKYLTYQKRKLFANRIKSILKNEIDLNFIDYQSHQTFHILINTSHSDSDLVERLHEKIQEEISAFYSSDNLLIFACLSPLIENIADLSKFNQDLWYELDRHFLYSEPAIFPYGKSDRTNLAIYKQHILFLIDAMMMGNERSITDKIDALFTLYKTENIQCFIPIRHIISEVIDGLKNTEISYKILMDYDIDEIMNKSDSLEELEEYFRDFCIRISGEDNLFETKKSLVEGIIDYININYMNPIDLNHIAEEFSINYNYLSGIFKKKMGMSFTKYLNTIRIERSKQILIGTDIKIYAVARDVGFSDEKYFMKVFRNLVKMTPGEYRNDRQ